MKRLASDAGRSQPRRPRTLDMPVASLLRRSWRRRDSSITNWVPSYKDARQDLPGDICHDSTSSIDRAWAEPSLNAPNLRIQPLSDGRNSIGRMTPCRGCGLFALEWGADLGIARLRIHQ